MFSFSFKPIHYQQAFWILLTFVSYKFVAPNEHSGIDIPHLDKIAHSAIFFILAACAKIAYKLPPIAQLLAWGFYGAIIEMVQSQTGYRSADILDWGANMVGVLLLLGASKSVSKIINNRKINND